MPLPLAALAWAALATGATVRTFHHPARALVQDGVVHRCAGEPGCDPSMDVKSLIGMAPVYALCSGRVIGQGPNSLHIASKHEPMILVYESLMQHAVGLGKDVGIGQQVGLANMLRFSVFAVVRQPTGQLTLSAVEPAAWLAARGLAVSVKSHPAAKWCEGGRKIVAPAGVPKCGLKLPTPASFMLLPVSVTSE